MLSSDPSSLVTSQLARPAAFVPAADVAVSNDDLVLAVRGERKRPDVPEGTSFVHVERPYGAFERRITVPKGVDTDRIPPAWSTASCRSSSPSRSG